MRTLGLFAGVVLVSACGSGLSDYSDPHATVVRGVLRRDDEVVLEGARLVVSNARGERLATVDVPRDGRFEFSVPESGRVRWLATNRSGHAARGEWLVQPGGVNDLGRLWLSSPQSVPWLVTERGLGFEERLTLRADGVDTVIAVAAGRVWFSDGVDVRGLAPRSGEEVTAVAGRAAVVQPGERSLTSFMIDGRFSPECWAVLAVRLTEPRQLVVWDAARGIALAEFPVPSTLVLFDDSTLSGVRGAFCDADALTLFHYTDGTHLTATRWLRGAAAPSVRSIALNQRRVGGLAANAAMLFDSPSRTFWRWDLETEVSTPAPDDASFIGYALDPSGNTVWSSFAAALRMADLTTGEYATVPGVVSASPSATWAIVDASRYRQTPLPPGSSNPFAYTLESMELRRVNLATRELELIVPDAAVVNALSVTRRDRPRLLVGDDGTLRVFLDGYGTELVNVETGARSYYWPESTERELLTEGQRLVVIESSDTFDSNDRTTNRAFFTLSEGDELRRRTFLEGPRSAPRLLGGTLYYTARDPLTAVTQVFQLDVDAR